MSSKSTARQSADVLSHWYTLVEDVQFSAQEFYQSLETEINIRKLPRLHMERIEYHEGGVVSDKRIYLRFMRERFAFDVCAAPFGTAYFFSLRLIEKPREGWLAVFGTFVALGALYKLLFFLVPREAHPLWYFGGIIALIVLSYFITRLIQSKQATGIAQGAKPLPDIDGFLLNLPGIGQLYESSRKDTYYRHDTRLLFQTLVTDIVKRKVEDVTSAKGVKLVNSYSYSPILEELYKRTTVMAETKTTEESRHAVA